MCIFVITYNMKIVSYLQFNSIQFNFSIVYRDEEKNNPRIKAGYCPWWAVGPPADMSGWKVNDLRVEAEKRGMSHDGLKKAELVEQLAKLNALYSLTGMCILYICTHQKSTLIIIIIIIISIFFDLQMITLNILSMWSLFWPPPRLHVIRCLMKEVKHKLLSYVRKLVWSLQRQLPNRNMCILSQWLFYN